MRTMRLVVSVNFKRGILEGHVDIKLERNAKCFLLNKGLKVEYCSIEFSQKIVELTDFKEYEVNFIVLDKPIKNIEVKYSGILESYENIFPYLKDRIDEEYTLLRTDTYFYPIFAEPTFRDIVNTISKSNFDAEIIVSGIPSGYSVAFGGEIRGNNLRIS
ncbi:MAG TPA: peptidase, partial [Thermoprotei archaeon]|nr:peptidase [Thermoprotei archaeon]